ncbi:MAG TPA: TonB-dependent receptor plug domain-containing protein [Candidatus Udaeobacter sp.]|nr:TonB-dependent receptor plug domain-containing protein [Candidatus Udaeobacter sp.]
MYAKINLALGTALAAIALCCFVESSLGQDALTIPVTENDDVDADDADDKAEKSRRRRSHKSEGSVNTKNAPWANANENRSLAVTSVTQMAEAESVVVTGSWFDTYPVPYPALPPVEGTRINIGKKTSFVKPEEFPTFAGNDFREVMATTPGIVVSEEPQSPIINFGYRGLNSQRSEFMQVLEDGISLKNEQFGFPETHYTPILDAVERIELIRAGAALQYGCQPGGALNFVMKMPRLDAPFHFSTRNVFGSYGYYRNYTEVDGTVGPFGYYLYYDHRQQDGFREANSDYELNNGSSRLVWDVTKDSQFILTLDFYDENHGEPGGMRRREEVNPPNSVFVEDGFTQTSRFFDRFRLERYYAMLEYQKFFSERTELEIKAFGGYLSRWSKRQRGGGFGTLPSGPDASTNSIQLREAWTEGVDARVRHDYDLFNNVSTIAGGIYFYHALQDRTDERGFTPDAESGMLRNLNTGETWDGAIFAENRFHFGRLSIVPGMRLEFLNQSVDEQLNVAKTGDGEPLASQSDFNFVPLFGLGVGYTVVEGAPLSVASAPVAGGKGAESKEVVSQTVTGFGPPRVELYGTVSQAYRPITYGELVPTGASSVVNGDLKEGKALQFEYGVRGKPLPYLNFDLGGFYFTFDDQIGEVILPNGFTSTENVGDARYIGFEAATELDILSLINGGAPSPYGNLTLYGNVTLLDAEFTAGPNDGKTPAYAPNYQVKTGAIYSYKNTFKVALLGTLVDDEFGDDGDSFEGFIPAYNVWDLTAEFRFWKGRAGVFAGIRNVFDESYWGEVREEGIMPALPRNYYGGFEFFF